MLCPSKGLSDILTDNGAQRIYHDKTFLVWTFYFVFHCYFHQSTSTFLCDVADVATSYLLLCKPWEILRFLSCFLLLHTANFLVIEDWGCVNHVTLYLLRPTSKQIVIRVTKSFVGALDKRKPKIWVKPQNLAKINLEKPPLKIFLLHLCP